MKHTLKVTAIILAMFVITQFIGLYVVDHYLAEENELPLGLETPEIEKESDYGWFFSGIVIAFIIAILLLFFLMKFRIEFVLKLWFFVVVVVSLVISFNAIIPPFKQLLIASILLALPLAFIKIYKTSFLIHNATELLIYPGIAAVFVPLLNIWTIIGLLILISAYDMWAVWHSGFMQKMAKYQINRLKIFSGFFVPYVSKQVRKRIKKMKKTMKKSELKKKRIKVNVAILGGGDVIFPIIAAGVMLKTLGLASAFLVLAGATLGLAYLFFAAEKRKFYPAMPFITAGIFVGMGISYILFSL
jgi:presenilin-like A22 family membrane protease